MSEAAGIFAAAREVQEKLAGAGFRFCFIGGFALQRWGEPRYTQDVDLSLLCPFGGEAEVAERLAALLEPRVADPATFAAQSRVFLARASNGTPVDIALAAIDFELRAIERATAFDLGGSRLMTCCAEDLVVMKVFAGRARDWLDVESIALRRGHALDWEMIRRELEPLLAVKDDTQSLARLAKLRPK